MKIQKIAKTSITSLAVGLGVSLSPAATAAVFDVASDADVRMIAGAGSRDDNNGGGNSDLVIGGNTGGIDNLVLYNFDLSALAGQTATGDATLTISPVDFVNANHGSASDQIAIYELFLTNAGWSEGTNTIVPTDNLTDDGSASFLNFAQFNDDPGPAGGVSVPWKDAGGSDAANLLGAISSALDTTAGYAQGSTPTELTFTIDQTTVQGWIDNGLAGIVVGTIDDGDGRSRFRSGSSTLSIDAVPEPGSLALLGLGGLLIARRRRD